MPTLRPRGRPGSRDQRAELADQGSTSQPSVRGQNQTERRGIEAPASSWRSAAAHSNTPVSGRPSFRAGRPRHYTLATGSSLRARRRAGMGDFKREIVSNLRCAHLDIQRGKAGRRNAHRHLASAVADRGHKALIEGGV